MRRFHLFEWEDQPWLPRAVRRYLIELLQHQTGEIYRPAVPILTRWLKECDCREVIDLGSGAGGPWPALLPALAEQGIDAAVTLTDRFPLRGPTPTVTGLRAHPDPVDALAVPETLTGCRTLFSCFHHLKPEEARTLLRRAAEGRTPIAIFEFTERCWPTVLGMLLSPLLVWAQTPMISRFSWGRLFWTYGLPVVPLVYLWDGLVSHLRSYTGDELRSMTEPLASPDYRWEVGVLKQPDEGITITYLLGSLAPKGAEH